MRSAEDEELRRTRERLEKPAFASFGGFPAQQALRPCIRRRDQLSRARPLVERGLENHRPLLIERADQVVMRLAERFDQHVNLTAAAETDRPGQVVADPVMK